MVAARRCGGQRPCPKPDPTASRAKGGSPPVGRVPLAPCRHWPPSCGSPPQKAGPRRGGPRRGLILGGGWGAEGSEDGLGVTCKVRLVEITKPFCELRPLLLARGGNGAGRPAQNPDGPPPAAWASGYLAF